ncbi:MAG: UPF0280 family protein [Comamonadaceae bacterium]|nr:MAG: UPF0280 family protein [Comamonadaceae bacterium]
MNAQRALLDARRWHFQHGPIDIVAEADGEPRAVARAHEAAWARFRSVLDELVRQLHLLRQPVGEVNRLQGPIARRMWRACSPYSGGFITPMAAVAGSVAQELVACYDLPGVERAWINNGGDIALHLAPGASVRIGLLADLARFDPAAARLPELDGSFEIDASMPVRGVATSGWRGRSFSLGIADSATVLAASAADADAAATVIGNAVDVQDQAIDRRPANECKDDSDLGSRLVTVAVGALSEAQVQRALEAGAARARAMQAAGLIAAAVLVCQGRARVLQPLCCARDRAGIERQGADAEAARRPPCVVQVPRGDPPVGSVFA